MECFESFDFFHYLSLVIFSHNVGKNYCLFVSVPHRLNAQHAVTVPVTLGFTVCLFQWEGLGQFQPVRFYALRTPGEGSASGRLSAHPPVIWLVVNF